MDVYSRVYATAFRAFNRGEVSKKISYYVRLPELVTDENYWPFMFFKHLYQPIGSRNDSVGIGRANCHTAIVRK
jgi:hypothetical protein